MRRNTAYIISYLTFVFTVFSLCGCEKATDVSGTTADKRMRISIINSIRMDQKKRDQSCSSEIIDAMVVRMKENRVSELWKVEDCRGENYYYIIKFTPLEEEGVNISITPPNDKLDIHSLSTVSLGDNKTKVPGETTTRGELRADVLKAILKIERLRSSFSFPRIVDTKVMSADDDVVIEFWRVQAEWREKINYVVRLTRSPGGGTDMAINIAQNNDAVNQLLDEEERRVRMRDALVKDKLIP